ncbi:hypothetical protein ACQEU5_23335 [Marinactinospora thermotolerans]|uniref:Uncharacterized protein n=1 Tax=Marinactinospora thermotolerans DSM 45154 TaxID=1122192 RepID=A0A1T4K324_9ACTN|nr:hypothetical protein [Marinactinospora thermotolerans]SJZ36687.1 hypothetical protein SAMN02745673_00131 [Marinactinospora thermotolerans DSM 45154]
MSGTTSVDHLEQNVTTAAVQLDDQAMADLDKVDPAAGIRGFRNRFRRP